MELRGQSMSLENAAVRSRARMIVVGNEKGGSGKSTIAIHLAVALLKSKERVATIDLDSRQKTFTHYIENRHAWAQQTGRDLEIPNHVYFVENMDHPSPEDEVADGKALADQVEELARDGAARRVVGIRRGAISGNMKVSFQAARSIG